MDLTADMNNVQLLEQAKITRELTRIRYANFTAKYKKDAHHSKKTSSSRVLRKAHSTLCNDSKNSAAGSGSTVVSSKRLLSSAMKMSIEELSVKSSKK